MQGAVFVHLLGGTFEYHRLGLVVVELGELVEGRRLGLLQVVTTSTI